MIFTLKLPDPNFWSPLQFSETPTTPEVSAFDSTLALMRDGYRFISRQCQYFHSDAFSTRLLGKRVVCLSSREAARSFYSDDFDRSGVAPDFVLKTLFGLGGVQRLDGSLERHRNALFVSFMSQPSSEDLRNYVDEAWASAIPRWQRQANVVLSDELRQMLCRAACHRCGVPAFAVTNELAHDCALMLDGFIPFAPRHWRARSARQRAVGWAKGVIEAYRQGELKLEEGSPAHALCQHTALNGEQLSAELAGVELLNLIHPICAISDCFSFAMLALRDHPQYRAALRKGSLNLKHFVQEVRRFYPFIPFVAARARRSFQWRGIDFVKGELALLDVYGLNHDPRYWDEPWQFLPQRFERLDASMQGTGDVFCDDHSAVEATTLQLMQQAVAHMLELEYEIPVQDLSFRLSRIPARPASGFVVSRLTRVQTSPEPEWAPVQNLIG